MPRIKRRSKKYADHYNEYEIEHLLEGRSIFGRITESDRFALTARPDEHNEPLVGEAWNLLGKQLTEQWIADRPGSRPWGWWRYDAPERRQRIDGVQHPFDNALRKDHIERVSLEHPSFRERAYRLHCGVPTCFIGCIDDDLVARYEGELAYLDRLNLLTPFERHALYGEPLTEGDGGDATNQAAV